MDEDIHRPETFLHPAPYGLRQILVILIINLISSKQRQLGSPVPMEQVDAAQSVYHASGN